MSRSRSRKKRRVYTEEETSDARKALKASLRSRLPLLLLMLGIFLLLAAVYYVLLRMQVLWASPVLYSGAAVLFLTFFFVNRGFSSAPVDPSVLPDDWSAERKARFAAEDVRRKALARRLMVPLVPVLLLVLADMLLLFIFPLFRV